MTETRKGSTYEIPEQKSLETQMAGGSNSSKFVAAPFRISNGERRRALTVVCGLPAKRMASPRVKRFGSPQKKKGYSNYELMVFDRH